MTFKWNKINMNISFRRNTLRTYVCRHSRSTQPIPIPTYRALFSTVFLPIRISSEKPTYHDANSIHEKSTYNSKVQTHLFNVLLLSFECSYIVISFEHTSALQLRFDNYRYNANSILFWDIPIKMSNRPRGWIVKPRG